MNMQDSIREWKEISPDLTRGDTILGNRYPAITAIAQSDLDSMRIYAGTQDGLIWTTADGGLNWTNITDGTPGFFVTSISCSTVNPEGVIATYSGYRDNNHQPYIYRSENAGVLWEPIIAELPMMGVNNLYILPGWNDDVLFAATDGGVYVSRDAGFKWERLGSNMPYMPVYDIDYNPAENKIIAATFSRGIMTFPVEELDLVSSTRPGDQVSNELDVHLYPTITSNQLFISCNDFDSNGEDLQVSIYDMEGKMIRSQTEHSDEVHKVTFMDKSSPGLYVAKVQSGRKMKTLPFIMQ
jgi:WD40 repeat protein